MSISSIINEEFMLTCKNQKCKCKCECECDGKNCKCDCKNCNCKRNQ